MHMKRHIRVRLHKRLNNFWQRIARLRMRSRNRQAATTFITKLLRHLLDAFCLPENLANNLEDSLTGWSDSR